MEASSEQEDPTGDGFADTTARNGVRSQNPSSMGSLSHRPHLFNSLQKSDSNASASQFSTKSCVSVSVTGTLPYGSLQVHKAADSPVPQPSPPSSVPKVLENGDVFLVLDLPAGFTVGCDAKALTSKAAAPIFGFRDFVPGAHFVFVSDPAAMTRCGYWFVTKEARGSNGGEETHGIAAGVVRIKQWDRYNEVLGEPVAAEARSCRDKLEEIYLGLLPSSLDRDRTQEPPPPPPKDQPRRSASPQADPVFAADDVVMWHHLTSSISEPLLTRVTGKVDGSSGKITQSTTGQSATREWLVDTTDSAKGDLNFAQASKLFKPVAASELVFLFPRSDYDLDIRLRTFGSGLTSESRSSGTSATTNTAAASPNSLDSSPLVESALARPDTSESDIVGELQFAFLTAMHLGNLSCVEYWWHFVLRVLLRAHQLVVSRPALVRSLILTVHAELVYDKRYLSTTSSFSGPGDNDSAMVRLAETESGVGSSILETMPQNKRRLREALTLYKRLLNESLLGLGDQITKEQGAVGHAFADLEAWFWTYGWDLRSDYVPGEAPEPVPLLPSANGRRRGLDGSDDDDDDDEYQPVIVELDEHGREAGLISFNNL